MGACQHVRPGEGKLLLPTGTGHHRESVRERVNREKKNISARRTQTPTCTGRVGVPKLPASLFVCPRAPATTTSSYYLKSRGRMGKKKKHVLFSKSRCTKKEKGGDLMDVYIHTYIQTQTLRAAPTSLSSSGQFNSETQAAVVAGRDWSEQNRRPDSVDSATSSAALARFQLVTITLAFFVFTWWTTGLQQHVLA